MRVGESHEGRRKNWGPSEDTGFQPVWDPPKSPGLRREGSAITSFLKVLR